MSIYDFLDNHPKIVKQNIKDISKHISIIPKYVTKHYPQYEWDFKSFSSNPNTTIEFVKQTLDKNWNWLELSKNIKLEDIINNLGLSWDYQQMSYNKTINIEFVKQNLDKDWDWSGLSRNIKLEDIINSLDLSPRLHGNILEIPKEFPDLRWDYYWMSYNKTINIKFVKQNLDKNWCWSQLSRDIKLEEINNNLNLPWNYYWMSLNKTINIEFVKQNLDKNWDWRDLSQIIKLEDIINNLNLPWDYYWMSGNKTINIDFVKQNLGKYWGWGYLSQNIKLEDIINNSNSFPRLRGNILETPNELPDLFLHKHENILKTPLGFLDLSWDYQHMSLNKTLTFEFILQNMDKNWDWAIIFSNNHILNVFPQKLVND